MSPLAKLILHAISTGYILRLPFDESGAALVVVPRHASQHAEAGRSIGPLESAAVNEVLQTELLSKAEEHRVHQKIGWRELGLDGDKADFYRFTQ